MKSKAHDYEINLLFRPETELPKSLKEQPSIIEQLKLLRKTMGMTQDQLAKKAGITQSRLAQIEGNPSQDLQLSTLRKIAAALDCELLTAFVPKQEISKTLDQKAEQVAQKLIRISLGNAALEKQLPSKAYRDIQLQEMKEEILKHFRQDLWKAD